jgi:hypothetical protein
MKATGGNGRPMREYFLRLGLARYSADVPQEFLESLEATDPD